MCRLRGQAVGLGCVGRLGVGGSIAVGSACLQSVPACEAHRRHVCTCLLSCAYVPCNARACEPFAWCHTCCWDSPCAGLCTSWPSTVQIPLLPVRPHSPLTPAIVDPCPSRPSLHPTLPAGHGHDLGVPLPAEYQILCGNQAPGFIIDIHTGKPIGE